MAAVLSPADSTVKIQLRRRKPMISENLYIAIVVWLSFGFLGFLALRSKDVMVRIKDVFPRRLKPCPMPDSLYENPVKDMLHRIEIAENSRKWYQQCINKNNEEVPLSLQILLKHSMQAAARFAVQEARDGRVSKRPEEQYARVESLLASCRLALIENGMPEEEAEITLKEGITFILYSFELSEIILPEGIISNPAEQYFDVRDTNL